MCHDVTDEHAKRLGRTCSFDEPGPQYDGSVPAPVCLIVNPSAGGGKAGRVAPEVERTLRGHGLEVRRVDTRDLDHARALAEEGARAGETVVALSGDGMIGVVADVLRHVPGRRARRAPRRSRQRPGARARHPPGSDRGVRGDRPRRPRAMVEVGPSG